MAMHARVFSRRCLDRASLAHIVRLGARVGAVVLLLADLRRLPPLPNLALPCLVRRDALLSFLHTLPPPLGGASHLRLRSFDSISGRSF